MNFGYFLHFLFIMKLTYGKLYGSDVFTFVVVWFRDHTDLYIFKITESEIYQKNFSCILDCWNATDRDFSYERKTKIIDYKNFTKISNLFR